MRQNRTNIKRLALLMAVGVLALGETTLPVYATETNISDTESAAENSTEVTITDINYEISGNFTKEEVPTGFIQSSLLYHGTECTALKLENGQLYLLYLVDSSTGKGRFYIYESTTDSFAIYAKIGTEDKFVVPLGHTEKAQIPDGYDETTIALDETTIIGAYQSDTTAEDDTMADFYLFYGMNESGVANWYQYDASEGTYQRYTGEAETAQDDYDALLSSYNALSEKYTKLNSVHEKMVIGVVIGAAVLLMLYINLLLRRKRLKEDDVFEDDNADEPGFFGEDMIEEYEHLHGALETEKLEEAETVFEDELDEEVSVDVDLVDEEDAEEAFYEDDKESAFDVFGEEEEENTEKKRDRLEEKRKEKSKKKKDKHKKKRVRDIFTDEDDSFDEEEYEDEDDEFYEEEYEDDEEDEEDLDIIDLNDL